MTKPDIVELIELIDSFHGNELKDRRAGLGPSVEEEVRVIQAFLAQKGVTND